jgi:predicted dehydrogenase
VTVRLAVAGAGLIGRRHLTEIRACPDTELVAVVDPSPAARAAVPPDVPLRSSLAELFATDRPDGVVLATPTGLHAQGALECLDAGVPVLVEKPLADSVEGARRVVRRAEATGVPVLTGHHRQHSPILAAAREVVRSGRLGRIVSVTGSATFRKPDGYFEENGGWRRQPGGGPILLNLVHDVNALQSLVGNVVAVQAMSSSATRGFAVEDTAAVLFRFAGGALGSFLVSDAALTPWSWEQTSRENPAYPTFPGEDCYHLGGTHGSLSIPTLRLRTAAGEPSWWSPMVEETIEVQRRDSLAEQVAHFARVVRGEDPPLVGARAGLAALLVTEAVRQSARTGREVALDELVEGNVPATSQGRTHEHAHR